MKAEDNWQKIIIPMLLAGEVGVFATDTLYGILGSALRKKTVERIYALRRRDLKKPMIILISSLADLKLFSIEITLAQKQKLKKIWPGAVSVVLDCKNSRFAYLHRGQKTLAFRLPADDELRKLLKKSGPLVAPSANISGKPSASTYLEAKKYFGEKIDFYVDEGKLKSKPSTIIRLGEDGMIKVLRQGKEKI